MDFGGPSKEKISRNHAQNTRIEHPRTSMRSVREAVRSMEVAIVLKKKLRKRLRTAPACCLP